MTGINMMNNVTTNGSKTIVIMTDGHENSSKLINHEDLTNLINDHKETYKFIFMGANQDAIKTAIADYKGKQEAMGKWQPE